MEDKGVYYIRFMDTMTTESILKENIKDLMNCSTCVRQLLTQLQSDEYYDLRDKYTAELKSIRSRMKRVKEQLHDTKCEKKFWKLKYDNSSSFSSEKFETYYNNLLETPDENIRGLVISYKELLQDIFYHR